jgi:hypothetical protein
MRVFRDTWFMVGRQTRVTAATRTRRAAASPLNTGHGERNHG